MSKARLAVDIGGTFTDLALEQGGKRISTKVLTTPRAPEEGVLAGIDDILKQAGVKPADLGLFIHGTTLATNAIIERKGARTALIVTEGFRDSIEMAFEHRFEQYDIFMQKPSPLVPRELRFGVPERLDGRGNVLIPLDEQAVRALAPQLKAAGIEAIAVGYMHAYLDGKHERRTREILAELLPGVSITLSSEVSPEIREYERWSTAVANAYVQPVMARYLGRLDAALRERGLACPLFLITSGGGLTTLETARRFPIRLVESGPAGGAILAANLARQCGLDKVLSFDMGGTTAKICLIDDGEPQYSRTFEVARQYRFLKGSGLPLRIPVIEMVEIGAGGGSIASVDSLARVNVGPESAGAEPGPVCYGRGGTSPTVTDADVVLGRLDPGYFAGGSITLLPDPAGAAIDKSVGTALGLQRLDAAFGVSEIVEENMANAARVHAVERGKEIQDRTLIAFGGAAPIHAARLAEKLGIRRIMVPQGAGVGSAVGFLLAPVAYEVVRSRYVQLDASFEPAYVNALFAEMRAEAEAVVQAGASGARLQETRTADMRYRGQGHEITVSLPSGAFDTASRAQLSALYEEAYAATFGRTIPGLAVEIMNWTLRLAAEQTAPARCPAQPADKPSAPRGKRAMYDPVDQDMHEVSVYHRADLAAGSALPGPAVIAEDETTTIVPKNFIARINPIGAILMERV
ncbi:hydantoinase/oxoprolinase family protein [Reyranella sp. CPCC 100927]|uniref:hydantoinase/oxoprolinase family protein n=1 Tax=Reyranella sp. CPCC 100927 TaxID=2599616 RepID=UPI0011B545A2|nr:hydantoinase/oxoprolinase family protein [Reyranella sp. CPCC 100927]TWT15569.1 hydantoinase/oxoprolinase family protein [Reyranella sp. CPCC 100927]